MAKIKDSYKKVFENPKPHFVLVIIAFVWTFLSALYNAKFIPEDSLKSNPVDIVFGLIVSIYGIQFLHNAIHNINGGSLPSFNEIKSNILSGLIKLNIVWGLYLIVSLAIIFIIYIVSHLAILSYILLAALIFIAFFINYIFISFAESFNTKNLCNINTVLNIIKPTCKELYTKIFLFLLITIGVIIVYICIYTVAELFEIDKYYKIAKDFYLIDLILDTISTYFIIITFYLALPYSLINSYNRYVRPVIRKDKVNELFN